MLIDTHAHLNFQAYNGDRNEVIEKSLDNRIWMINVGSNYQTSQKAVEIAEKYKKGVYVAVGLHPINIKHNSGFKVYDSKNENVLEDSFDYEKYKKLTQSPKVVALGEIGLDYWRKPKTKKKLELFKQKQKEIFLKQLELTKELNLPVIFHCRMAHQDLIEILLKNSELKPQRAVAHSFVGSPAELQQYLNFGFYIGFNSIIFKSIKGISFEENIKLTPLNRILIETDCPFLTPPISVNQRLDQCKSAVVRNEPLYVKYVAQRIAEIKNITFEEVAEKTTKNAKKLFKIP